MNKTIASLLCTLLLSLLLIAVIASWVMAVMGMEVHNVLSPEGYRWICLHALECLTPPYLAPCIALVISVGCLHYSGVVSMMRRKRRTVNENLGLIAGTTAFLVLSCPIIVPVFKINSALRSVTGQLIPSPWFHSLPFSLSLIVFLSTLCYCLFARKERFYRTVGSLVSTGVSRYALWLVDLSLLNFLIEIVKYTLG